MPVTLAELSGATLPPPPRYNKPVQNRSFSVIDDVFSPLPNGTIPTIPTIGPNGYNSDDIISGNGVPTRGDFKMRNKVPQDWVELNSTTNFNPRLANQFRTEPMRTVSEAEVVRQANQGMYPVAPVDMQMVAGMTPPVKQVMNNEITMGAPVKQAPFQPMKSVEKFSHRRMNDGGQTCIETLNHIMNCPMCQKYFECDTKIYNVIIIMLILLFTTIIFFLYKEEKKR